MSNSVAAEHPPGAAGASFRADAGGSLMDDLPRLPITVRYGLSLLAVAGAVVLALVVDQLIAPPNLSLIFVLPVVISATLFGWGPSLGAGLAGVLAYDFFFTEPRYTFEIARPSDIWATALLLVIAAIVSGLAAQSRRLAVEARRSAEQAQALQVLAQAVIEAKPQAEIVQTAATALNRIFRAPAVIFVDLAGDFRPVATAGSPVINEPEAQAARGVLDSHLAARADTYPYSQSMFDLWPVGVTPGVRCVLGVSFGATASGRPIAPERLVELVGGYLTVALNRESASRT